MSEIFVNKSSTVCSNSFLDSLNKTYLYTNQAEYPKPTNSMTFGNNGMALIAPTTVEDNHNAAVAPATYVITWPLVSVSSHFSETVFTKSFVSIFSARPVTEEDRCVTTVCC